MNETFTLRELSIMAMCIEHYINMKECPESDKIKKELNECTRKLHYLIDESAEYV